MARKLDLDSVKAQFELAGCEMLSEYVNSRTPVLVRCKNGHERSTRLHSVMNGSGCHACSNPYSDPLTARKRFELAGYELLGDYVNSSEPVLTRCKNGHERRVRLKAVMKGIECNDCSGPVASSLDAAKRFGLAGYSLLEEYINCKTPTLIKCSNGHERRVSLNSVRLGNGCRVCSRPGTDKTAAIRQFEVAGYELLEDYVNTTTPILVRCKNGHERKLTVGTVRHGSECLLCSKHYVDPLLVKQAFEAEGYKMLAEYVNALNPIAFECPSNHRHAISWSHFQKGHRCGICAGWHKSHSEVEAAFKAAGYQLKTQYKRSTQKLAYVCPYGHEHLMSWNSFQSGTRCAHCSGQIVDHGQVEATFEAEGYQLLSQYEKSDALLEFVCPKNHRHRISWDNFKYGCRCGICATEEDYAGFARNRAMNRIVAAVRRNSAARKTREISADASIQKVAEKIESFYLDCPKGYHVDHIIPQSWFDHSNQNEVEACWSIHNLRYLPATENLRRNNRPLESEIAYMQQNHPGIYSAASRIPRLYLPQGK